MVEDSWIDIACYSVCFTDDNNRDNRNFERFIVVPATFPANHIVSFFKSHFKDKHLTVTDVTMVNDAWLSKYTCAHLINVS